MRVEHQLWGDVISPVLQFFLQLFAVLIVCRVVGACLAKIGQPAAMGEMLAGILLGPTLLGHFLPETSVALFPAKSLEILTVLSQFGLTLYLFFVGLEVDFAALRKNARTAASVSFTGIAVPVLMAGIIALWWRQDTLFFGAQVSVLQKFLFLAACLSVTAFPMLARILEEKGLAQTRLGSLTLMAASLDDIVCWVLLSVVVASVHPAQSNVWLLILGTCAFVVGLLLFAKPVLLRLEQSFNPTKLVLLVLFFGFIAEVIGMHALLGAFWLGLVMPRTETIHAAAQKIRPAVTLLFLPLFFVCSGLKTQIQLLNSWALWGTFLGLFLAATLCKLGACYFGARLVGESHRDSFAIGSLMNARGLVELVVLNVGLQAGLITPPFFALMVLVAIVTTWVAVPLFEWSRTWQIKDTAFAPLPDTCASTPGSGASHSES